MVIVNLYYLQEINELTESMEEVVSPDITVLVSGKYAVNLYLPPFLHVSILYIVQSSYMYFPRKLLHLCNNLGFNTNVVTDNSQTVA